MDAFNKTWQVFERALGSLAMVIALGAVAVSLLEIFRRYVLGVVFVWGNDAVVYFMISGIFLYFGVTQAHRNHLIMPVVVDVFIRRQQMKVALAMRVLSLTFTLVFVGSLVFFGFGMVEHTREGSRQTASLTFLLWPFQYVLLVSLLIMAIVVVYQLYRSMTALVGKPEEVSPDELTDRAEF